MSVIIVPTWAIWAFVGFAVANIVQHVYKLILLRRLEKQGTSGSKP